MNKVKFEKSYEVDEKHIDVQGIMDGLYYPFYLEYCRHAFLNEVLGFDLGDEAKKGVNIVLTQYLIRFKRPLKRGDKIIVSCDAHPDKGGAPVFHLVQEIRRDGKLISEGLFTATFVRASGGRSYLPESVTDKISDAIPIDAP